MRDINSISQKEFTNWLAEPMNSAFLQVVYRWMMERAYQIDETSLLCFVKGVALSIVECQKIMESPEYNANVKWQ